MAKKKTNRSRLPSLEEIRSEFAREDAKSRKERARRYRKLLKLFPMGGGMVILGGMPATLALEEVWRSYIGANHLSVVMCAQNFLEHSLAANHIMSGDDLTAEGGFSKLIDIAKQEGVVEALMAERMHRLRKMRNPYVHPRSYSRPRNYMARVAENGFKESLVLLEEDAEFAIALVSDFIRPSPEATG
jgi:hypothetical protein